MSNSHGHKMAMIEVYREVVNDVITSLRDNFAEEGVEEDVLNDLKQLWLGKLENNKAVGSEIKPELKPKVEKPVNIVSHNSHQTHQQHLVEKTVAPTTTTQVVQAVPQMQTKMVPIQVTLPAQGVNVPIRHLTLQVPAFVLQNNQLQKILTGPVISTTMNLPPAIASSVLQQHINASCAQLTLTGNVQTVKQVNQTDGQMDISDEEAENKPSCSKVQFKKIKRKIVQTDGSNYTSDDDDEEDDEEESDDGSSIEMDRDSNFSEERIDDDPLNSEDDVTDEEQPDLFDTDNVLVCQYDKITRTRNKWKFFLKDGIMNLNGKDYVFQKAIGEAEW